MKIGTRLISLLVSMSFAVGAAYSATPSASPAKDPHEKGTGLVSKQSYEEAIAHFDKAIQLDPKDVAPYLERAICYMHLKQYRKAIDDCKSVLSNDKAHKKEKREAYMIAAGAANMLGESAEAIDYSSKGIALEPSALAYADRAVAYRKLGKLEDALLDANQAIKMDPKGAGYYDLRSTVYNLMARSDRAKSKELRASK